MASGESICSRQSNLMKDLKRVYGKLTLQQKLVSAENVKRMRMGKTVAHKIGAAVPCVPVAPRAVKSSVGISGGAGAFTYKMVGGHSTDPTSSPAPPAEGSQVSSKAKTSMSVKNQSAIISGQGTHLPRVQKDVNMGGKKGVSTGSSSSSTPSSSSLPTSGSGSPVLICGLELPAEVHQAVTMVGDTPQLESCFFARVEQYEPEVCANIIDVHESIQGRGASASHPSAVAEYLAVIRMSLLSANQVIPRADQSMKLRFAVREGGKIEKALIEGERLAREAGQSHLPPATSSKRELNEDENAGESEAAILPQTKALRRSTSNTSMIAMETGGFPLWEEEEIDSGVETVREVDVMKDEDSEESREVDEEEEEGLAEVDSGSEAFNKEDYHAGMESHTRGMRAASVNFDMLESDSEDDKKMTHAERRWAMMKVGATGTSDSGDVEGYKSFIMGPTTPDTQHYLVIGCKPLDDKSVKEAVNQQKNFAAALQKGDKKSKHLSSFNRTALQKSFAPGSYAFSSAIRHEKRENEKTNPWNTSITVPFKTVFATSDRQFRHLVWAQMMGENNSKPVFICHLVLAAVHDIYTSREIPREESSPGSTLEEGQELQGQG